jgi:hypothetical protein
MSSFKVAEDIRTASRIHARLLDAFIALTMDELAVLPTGYVEESLRESLESLRAERRAYGTMAGVMPVSNAA